MDVNFRVRFLFATDQDKARAKKMGISDLNKKYELNEIVKGDSIFCATGITSTEMVAGCKKRKYKIYYRNSCHTQRIYNRNYKK